MTKAHGLKTAIRERMAKTGEGYSAARSHVASEKPDPAPSMPQAIQERSHAILGAAQRIFAIGENLLVAGPTSSGTTTFLDEILNSHSDREPALVIEYLPELHLGPHDTRMVIQYGESLPDWVSSGAMKRIVSGAIRSTPEAISIMDHVGHGGQSMAIIHAGTTEEAWERLASLAGRPLEDVRQAFPNVIVMARDEIGRRYPAQITGCDFQPVMPE